MGMLSALLRHQQTGATDRWPVHVAGYALGFFGFGLLVSLVTALL
jgi:hypothetical protein